jgi:hypothetical protein
MEKKLTVQIVELFMAKAGRGNKGFDRCFHGTIKREKTEDDKPVVRGKIKVNQGYIWAEAEDQWALGEMLDEMVLMILDYDLHGDIGKQAIVAESPLFLN